MALVVVEPSTTICVGNLPDDVTPRELRLSFKFAAGVQRCVVNHTKTGRQVGYARFGAAEEAQAAIDWLNGFPLDETCPKPLKVFMSSTQLRDPLPGMAPKRPLEGWTGPPAKVMRGGFGGGFGMGGGFKGGFGGNPYGMGGGFGFNPSPFGGFGGGFGFGGRGGYGKGGFGGFGKGGFGFNVGMAPPMGKGGFAMGGFGGKGKGKGKGAPQSPNSIYVGGVPHEWDELTLQSLFEAFGAITTVQLRRGNNPVGNIAFVHYSNPQEAQAAIENLNNYPLDGTRHLVVRGNRSRGL